MEIILDLQKQCQFFVVAVVDNERREIIELRNLSGQVNLASTNFKQRVISQR